MRNISRIVRRLWPMAVVIVFTSLGCAVSRSPGTRNGRLRTDLISLLDRPLPPIPAGETRSKLEADLRAAQRDLKDHPNSPELHVWLGRRWGYLWKIEKAIEVFTVGIARHPNYAPLYRHRGHRYISARRFQDAIGDLERAVELLEGQIDEIEQDGAPNDRNIPLTTTGFNVWYHLALAKYLTRDFDGAVQGFRKAKEYGRGFDDNFVATTDWIYMALRRQGKDREATAMLEPIRQEMQIIENDTYHRRLLMYKGIITPDELLDLDTATELDLATLGYGLGNWYLCNGDTQKAHEIFRRVVDGPNWPAFGFIAAEVEMAHPAD